MGLFGLYGVCSVLLFLFLSTRVGLCVWVILWFASFGLTHLSVVSRSIVALIEAWQYTELMRICFCL